MEFDFSSGIQAENGLPQELFLAVSALTPIPNVDLFVLDKQGRILLSWRDDIYFGSGWHLPGGCIRFKETMLERIQETARQEIGCNVAVDEAPLAIRDVIIRYRREGLGNQNHRAHHLAVLFRCYLPDDFAISETDEPPKRSGAIKWFERIPDEMLRVHDVYADVFQEYGLA